jgi:hypothetical protein
MENNETTQKSENKSSKWKSLVKKFGIGGIIFYCKRDYHFYFDLFSGKNF